MGGMRRGCAAVRCEGGPSRGAGRWPEVVRGLSEGTLPPRTSPPRPAIEEGRKPSACAWQQPHAMHGSARGEGPSVGPPGHGKWAGSRLAAVPLPCIAPRATAALWSSAQRAMC